MAGLLENYRKVVERINKARERSGFKKEVTMIAVTKNVTTDLVKEAASIGIKHFGENRVQEALPKLEDLPQGLSWHFIGHLQSNKVKYVLPRFHMIHSLDRLSLAKELNKRALKDGRVVDALVQVNIAEEESKFGLSTEETEDFIKKVADSFPGININGLMTIAPYVENVEEVRPVFRQLKELYDHITINGVVLQELSMGMTNDFEVAIEEGATMVRIGTALFGKRY